MESDLEIAAVQPKLLSYDHRNQFEYAGAAGGFIDYLGYPFCRGRIFDTAEEDKGQYNNTLQVFWSSGACFVVRAEIFHSLGGFDESFFAHMEEIDLCWRINGAGKKVMACTESVIYHVGAGTLPVTNPRKTFLNFGNNLSMLTKNLPIYRLIWILPFRFILDWVAIFKFFWHGSIDHSLAVLRAHGNFITSLPAIWPKRRAHQKINRDLIYTRSIVFDYFIRGFKKYQDLPN